MADGSSFLDQSPSLRLHGFTQRIVLGQFVRLTNQLCTRSLERFSMAAGSTSLLSNALLFELLYELRPSFARDLLRSLNWDSAGVLTCGITLTARRGLGLPLRVSVSDSSALQRAGSNRRYLRARC